ncbi:MAG: hypothetical protein ABSC92_15090 [Rhizomicrobium sp.]|jgi:hypothetical protein
MKNFRLAALCTLAFLPLFGSPAHAQYTIGHGTCVYATTPSVQINDCGGVPLLAANNLSDVATPLTARANLGLAIGTNVEAWNTLLDEIAASTWTGASSITTLGTIGTGTWHGTPIGGAYLANPGASSLGGIESIASASHEWVSYIDTSGVPHQSQPAYADISGLASAATKGTGNSVADPGSGSLEIFQTVQTAVTGASKSWATTDCNKYQQRSNSGSAMTDTLPAGTGGCSEITIENSDASATDTFSVTGGGTISGNSTYALTYGRRATFSDDGAGNYRTWISNNSEARGPSSSTANDIADYCDTTGKLLCDSGIPYTGVSQLSVAETFSAVKTFTNSDIRLLGSSTGYTTFTSANAGASNYTLTFPAATDTVAYLAASQTLTNKTINGSNNTITNVSLTAGVTGTLPVGNGGTNCAAAAIGCLNDITGWSLAGISGINTGYLMDTATSSPAQGDVAYFNNAGEWIDLGPGASGRFLETQGPSANPVWASTISSYSSVLGTTTAAGVTNYMPMNGYSSSGLTTSAVAATVFERSGTLGHVGVNGQFLCAVDTAPGTGFSDVCAVYLNGTGATAITCTISNSATSCTDTSDTVTVTAGQEYEFTIAPGAGATSTGHTHMSVSFTSP